MLNYTDIERVVDEVVRSMRQPDAPVTPAVWAGLPPIQYGGACKARTAAENTARRQESAQFRAQHGLPPDETRLPDAGLPDAHDSAALARMIAQTPARIGVGRAGARLRTETLLRLRADHAAARDAVWTDVDDSLVEQLALFPIRTCCQSKAEFITRPDLGRVFSEDTLTALQQHCTRGIDVQLIVSDGLSSTAVSANAPRILPIVLAGLKEKGLSTGTPVFVKYGRVAAQDHIAQALDAAVVCSFIGERPGLATAESMSAYISYRAHPGMPESRRTVVSNIHRNGIPAVEAGAYLVDLIAHILEQKASGVALAR